MIFIGPTLSNPDAHFVTNIIACIGTGHDLIVDLRVVRDKDLIFRLIKAYLQKYDERYVIYNAYEDEDFFIDFKRHFPNLILFTFFSDDEWRHANYDRYLALYSDFFSIAPKSQLELYSSYGLNNGMICQWACNPQDFYPLQNEKKIYDVTFIGAAYGNRVKYIRFLLECGINIKVFGKGWNKVKDIRNYWGGFLSREKMLKIISQSKINLNFLWTSYNPDQTMIKGRTIELSACKAFQLSNYNDELKNYGFQDGLNIAIFHNKEEMAEKINYYLNHCSEMEKIADASYCLALKQHTWKQRFDHIFEMIKNGGKNSNLKKYNILVVLYGNASHNINVNDARMNIDIVYLADFGSQHVSKYDGIIFLEKDSTINNEALRMMAFAINNDKSDIVLSNFRIKYGKKEIWIRFNDKYIEKNRDKILMIPIEAKMYSPKTAIQIFNNSCTCSNSCLSFVEYPTFSFLDLGFFRKKKLQMFFACYDKKKAFINSIKSFHLLNAIDILVDCFVQKKLKKY